MRKKPAPSRFYDRYRNLTRPGVEVLGEVYDPERDVTAFEEVVRVFRAPAGSAIASGDHLERAGKHYVVSPHSGDDHLMTFRLISLPENLPWKIQPAKVKDLVTGQYRIQGAAITSQIWVRKITRGFSPDLKAHERELIRYICGSSVKDGDLIDGRIILRTWEEQGVLLAET